jgi:4'-phosphopantetheinyl transferase
MPSCNLPEWDELLAAAHAWHLDPDRLTAELLRRWSLEWFDEPEIALLDRLVGQRLQHMRIAARGLLRVVLSHYTAVEPGAWKFVAGVHGKPGISAPAGFESLQFNLTHTAALVSCAVSRSGEVGVDAEETSRAVDIDQVSRHFFSLAEQKRLAELPDERRTAGFFEQWVLKEAYLKGQGTGLAQSPDDFTIGWSDDGQPHNCGNWQFALDRPTPRHVAAVAVHSHGGQPIRVEWREADRLVARFM